MGHIRILIRALAWLLALGAAALTAVLVWTAFQPRTTASDRSDANLVIVADFVRGHIRVNDNSRLDALPPFKDAESLARAFGVAAPKQPPYGSSYIVNASLSDVRGREVSPGTIVVVEPRDEPDGTRGFVCLSGAVHRVSDPEWRRIYRVQLHGKYPVEVP